MGSIILPAYSVRESRRATRISLRVLPPEGRVEVVIPQGYDTAIAPLMVEQHRQWIAQQQQKMVATAAAKRESRPPQLPNSIYFAATDARLDLHYHEVDTNPPSIQLTYNAKKDRLFVIGSVSNHALVVQGLQDYLKAYGKNQLPIWLSRLATQHETNTPNRVTVRLQQSRWGSCSSKGNISLNAKLLLLPPHLVEHVILHELAHLRIPNHSQSFWNYLATMNPEWKQHRAQLRQLEPELPFWVGKQC